MKQRKNDVIILSGCLWLQSSVWTRCTRYVHMIRLVGFGTFRYLSCGLSHPFDQNARGKSEWNVTCKYINSKLKNLGHFCSNVIGTFGPFGVIYYSSSHNSSCWPIAGKSWQNFLTFHELLQLCWEGSLSMIQLRLFLLKGLIQESTWMWKAKEMLKTNCEKKYHVRLIQNDMICLQFVIK